MAEFAQAFLTGCPIDHALSPYIHRYWLQFYNLKGSYEAVLTTAESFPRFLADMRQKGFCGGAITLPHKEAALALTARADAAAKTIGAVNTVWLEDGALCGANSDWQGFIGNLDDYAAGWTGETALILGGSGAVRAVIYAVLQRRFRRIILADAQRERAEKSAAVFARAARAKIAICGLDEVNIHLPRAALLVNCGAAGAGGTAAAAPSLCRDTPAMAEETEEALTPFGFMDFSRAAAGSVAADIAYTPAQTAFLQAAAAAGVKTVDGLGMLLHQAVAGFAHWFGERPQVTPELRRYIIGKIGA